MCAVVTSQSRSSVKSRTNAFEALGAEAPKKKVVKEVVPEKVFVPIVSSTSNWFDNRVPTCLQTKAA